MAKLVNSNYLLVVVRLKIQRKKLLFENIPPAIRESLPTTLLHFPSIQSSYDAIPIVLNTVHEHFYHRFRLTKENKNNLNQETVPDVQNIFKLILHKETRSTVRKCSQPRQMLLPIAST